VHKICEFYKKIYLLSPKLPKKDRFGIYLKIENICLEIMDFTITSSFEAKNNKFVILNSARIKIEVLKRLFRVAYELNIIENKKYINIELDLQEISKMTNGWIKYLRQFWNNILPFKKSPADAGFLFWKLLARTQVRIGLVGIVPVDVELAVIPVDIRNVAIRVTRTR